MLKKKKNIIALLLVPQYFLITLLSYFPDFVEQYYSHGLYPFISKTLRYTLGWMPFSFGDLIYTFTIVYAIRWVFKNRKRIKKDTKSWLIDVFSAVSIFYFVFHLFWGFNYYRLPLHESLNINDEYSNELLIKVTEQLIKKSNALHLSITNNDTIKVDLPFEKTQILNMMPSGYRNLNSRFADLKYSPKSVKTSLYSYLLTYMGFSGYLNPFTNEAQVNRLIPVYKFPTTTAHEMAHQLGYAAENEANFIGWLAATNHDDLYIRYTGYTFGLRFCLNEIYRRDECLYEDLVADVNLGIAKNYKEVRQFWEVHDNPAEPIFKIFYSNFLKANKQDKGMDSYSYVVALLVNYIEKEPLY